MACVVVLGSVDPGARVARTPRVAIDLPAEDPQASFSTYVEVVIGALDGAGEDRVLVGHSLGGHTVPLVAAKRPLTSLVHLCALVPQPGASFADQLGTEPDMLHPDYTAGIGEPDANGLRGWVDLELARRHMYADCDDGSVAQALGRMRKQALAPYTRPCPLEAFPDTPATYVVCTEDQLVQPDWSRSVAADRLGADIVELPGSHSPFWSRPQELAEVLVRVPGVSG